MKILTIAIGFLSAAVLCGRASGAETDFAVGTQANPLQQAGGTARAMGMGSAFVAVPDGSGSLLWNPAALSRMGCKEVGLHSNTGLGGVTQEIAIVGVPLGEVKEECDGGSLGGIAASLGYVDYGSFNGTNANGVATGNYGGTADFNGSLGYGKEILPGLSGGISLKGDHSRYASNGYSSFAADLGALWTVIPNVDLGLVYSNINLGGKIGGNQLNEGWRLGAGWHATRHWLLAASGELQTKSLNRLQMGTEYLIGNLESKYNVLALRAGYVVNYPDPQLTGLSGMTFGLGYTITKSMAVDYAMLPMGELGTSQRLSLTFKFGCPEKPKPAPAYTAAAPVAAAAVAPIEAAAEAPPVVVKSIVLEDSHFDFDKSELRPEGMAALRENLELLKENPTAKVRVAGYTSMSGTAEYNQKLSERRAAAVEKYLVAAGIAPSRITSIGYGETRPKTYEAKPRDINSAAAKSNMRVLFEVSVK